MEPAVTSVTPDSIHLPFAVDLPAGWRQVDPTLTGSGQTAFAAVRAGSDPVFTPTITLEIDRATREPDYVSVADSAAGRLAAQVDEVVVLDRTPIAGDGPRGMTQVLRLRLPAKAGSSGVELVQSQVHLGIPLDAAGDDVLVVQLTCTSTPHLTAQVAGEFEQFVASFRLRPPEQEGRDDR